MFVPEREQNHFYLFQTAFVIFRGNLKLARAISIFYQHQQDMEMLRPGRQNEAVLSVVFEGYSMKTWGNSLFNPLSVVFVPEREQKKGSSLLKTESNSLFTITIRTKKKSTRLQCDDAPPARLIGQSTLLTKSYKDCPVRQHSTVKG